MGFLRTNVQTSCFFSALLGIIITVHSFRLIKCNSQNSQCPCCVVVVVVCLLYTVWEHVVSSCLLTFLLPPIFNRVLLIFPLFLLLLLILKLGQCMRRRPIYLLLFFHMYFSGWPMLLSNQFLNLVSFFLSKCNCRLTLDF